MACNENQTAGVERKKMTENIETALLVLIIQPSIVEIQSIFLLVAIYHGAIGDVDKCTVCVARYDRTV